MKYDKFNRRFFLQGSGGLFLALPFLPSLMPKELWAQEIRPFSKAIFFLNALGHGRFENYYPAVQESQKRKFNLKHGLGDYQGFEADLEVRGNKISNIFGSQFVPYKDHMSLYRGLDFHMFDDGHHSNNLCLGNYGGWDLVNCYNEANRLRGENLDSCLAREDELRKIIGSQSIDNYMVKTLKMGSDSIRICPDYFRNSMRVFSAADRELPTTARSAQDLFNLFFNTRTDSNKVAAGEDNPYKSVIDAVIGDYKKVTNGTKIGNADKVVLEEHISDLRDLEVSIGKNTLACDTQIKADDLINDASANSYVKAYKDQISVMTTALKCGLQRVGVVNMQSGHASHESLNFDATSNGKIHDRSHECIYGSQHNDENRAGSWKFAAKTMMSMQQFYAENAFLHAAKEMDKTNYTGSGDLENTILFWTQEHSVAHSTQSIPTAILTKMSKVNTGKYIDYSNWAKIAQFSTGQYQDNEKIPWGQPHRRILVSLLDACGFNGSSMPDSGANAVGMFDTRFSNERVKAVYTRDEFRKSLPKFLKS